MRVWCKTCGLAYDDLYRWTYCPHEAFEMRTLASRGGKTKLCTSVEELCAFLEALADDPRPEEKRWA